MDPPLHYAAGKGHIREVQYLISHNANVHTITNDGYTPLLIAADNFIIIQALIISSTDINVNTGQHWTALHEAVSGGNKNVAEVLLENGANVNATNWLGNAP